MAADDRGLARAFGKITVRLVHDDIASRKVDALVNAANDRLVMGGGVAAAPRSRGGIEIHQEAIAQAPAPLGSVVRTGAGKLPARYVYHAVVIGFDLAGGTQASDVVVAVKGVLNRAQEDGVNSLAMPLFGAGVGGLGVRQSLEAILDSVERAAAAFDRDLAIETLYRLRLRGRVLSQEETLKEFEAIWAKGWSDTIRIVSEELTAGDYKRAGRR